MAPNITRGGQVHLSSSTVRKKKSVCVKSESDQASKYRAGFMGFSHRAVLRRAPCLMLCCPHPEI